MIPKLFVSMTIVGLVSAYFAMLYAFLHIVALMNASYLLSLAS
jgi:hypothetical protein